MGSRTGRASDPCFHSTSGQCHICTRLDISTTSAKKDIEQTSIWFFTTHLKIKVSDEQTPDIFMYQLSKYPHNAISMQVHCTWHCLRMLTSSLSEFSALCQPPEVKNFLYKNQPYIILDTHSHPPKLLPLLRKKDEERPLWILSSHWSCIGGLRCAPPPPPIPIPPSSRTGE